MYIHWKRCSNLFSLSFHGSLSLQRKVYAEITIDDYFRMHVTKRIGLTTYNYSQQILALCSIENHLKVEEASQAATRPRRKNLEDHMAVN